MLVGLLPRLAHAGRAALDGGGVGVGGVGDRQCDHARAVAVEGVVLRDLVAGGEGAGEDEPDAPLLEDVRGAVAQPGLEAGVGHLPEAEGARVEVGGLLGVADPELDVVDAVERHEVMG